MFKTEKIKLRSTYLNPTIKSLMEEMENWVRIELGIEAVITDTVSTPAEDAKLKRVSATHREGRAFDMSTRGWKREQIVKFMGHFEKEYGSLGAITKSGRRSLIIWHNAGTGDHFHVQIARDSSFKVDHEAMIAQENGELKA